MLTATDSVVADRKAIERMVAGEHDALSELYDRHGRIVCSVALRVLRDQSDAEDIVQEVFSQVWKQSPSYDAGRGSVMAWLLTLTRSRAIDRLRGRRSRPESGGDQKLLSGVPSGGQLPDEQLMWSGDAQRIRTALDDISTVQRVAIELAFFEGLTHAEISERLELPLGTVKTRIRQGLLTLRDRLAGAFP